MVAYLLDTHVVLWALTDPTRLGPQARPIVDEPSSDLVVSAVTAWEVGAKHRLSKLPQADGILAGYSGFLDRMGARRLPVQDDHALLAGRLEWTHRDPFDRMLAAQAMLESHVLITADSVFADLRGVRVVW